MKRRSFIVRTALLVLIAGLAAYLFHIGKGHTVLLDTNAVEADGKEFRSAEVVSVSVDGREPEEMGRAERVIVDNLMGADHRIVIEVVSGEEKKIETVFSVPVSLDTAVLSVAAILSGAPKALWVKPFTESEREEEPVEKTVQQDEKDVIQLKKP